MATPSFINNVQGVREAILGTLHGRITAEFAEKLRSFDRFVSYCETLTNLGTQVSGAGLSGRIQVTNKDLEEHLGENLFEEMRAVAIKGRAFLDEHGYGSKTRVAPAVLLSKDDASATVLVSPYKVENPGEPAVEGFKISTLEGEPKNEQA